MEHCFDFEAFWFALVFSILVVVVAFGAYKAGSFNGWKDREKKFKEDGTLELNEIVNQLATASDRTKALKFPAMAVVKARLEGANWLLNHLLPDEDDEEVR
jgi:hypothetical protein